MTFNSLNSTYIEHPISIISSLIQVIGLTESLEYTFRVCAENLAGNGKFSRPSELALCEDNIECPGQPEVVSVSTNSIEISWEKPSYDGGSKIIGRTYMALLLVSL